MIKIVVELFENSAEISSYERTDGGFLEYIFKPSCDGYVNICGESYKINDGVCTIDVARLKSGEIQPLLITADKKIHLPAMTNDDGEYKIIEYDADFIRKLSLDRLRMSKRICELEKKLDELSKRVYRTTIF